LFGSLPPSLRSAAIKTGKEFAAYDRVLDTATAGPMWLKDDRVAECVVESLLFAAPVRVVRIACLGCHV
jgi:hypothetical protein